MRKLIASLFLSSFILQPSAFAQFAERWTAAADRPAPRDITAMRGETFAVEPLITSAGIPADLTGMIAAFYWQTNGMGAAWWSSPATVSAAETGRVSAVWSRTNDVGATAYTWFIGLDRGGTATAYRAFGRIAMRPSPGFNPSVLPPPSAYPTLAAELAPLVAPLIEITETDPSALAAIATQRVERVWAPDGTEYRDGTGGVWRAEAVAGGWTLDIPALGLSSPISGLAFPVATNWNGSGSGYSISVAPGGTGYNISVTTGFGEWGATDAQSESPIQLAPISQGENGPATLTYSTNSVNWSHVATVALDTSLTGLATRAELAPYVTGTVLTQQTSHVMAQWYDVTGCVTQQILRVGIEITTNRWGPRVMLPDGIATNITDGVTSGTYSEATRTFDISAITKKITKPILSSATNIVVASTNAVYYVALTNAANIGIDWSGLALDGTVRAEVTLRLNVTGWGGTNVTFSPSLTFDQTPEILVTGVWEFAASTIDGVTTRVSQTWPTAYEWVRVAPGTLLNGSGGMPTPGPYPTALNYSSNEDAGIFVMADTGILRFMRVWLYQNSVATGITFSCDSYYRWGAATAVTKPVTLPNNTPTRQVFAASCAYDYTSPPYGWDMCFVVALKCAGATVSGWLPEIRIANANERAAYAAGWRP